MSKAKEESFAVQLVQAKTPVQSLIGRKVTNFRTHATLHVNGAGELGTFISLHPAQGKPKKFKTLEMTIVAEGIYLTGQGDLPNAPKFESLVPFNNIVGMELAPG